MKEISFRKVRIFRIGNRQGYAAVCLNHLTEGKTSYQAYARMRKALKRSGLFLRELKASSVSRMVTSSK